MKETGGGGEKGANAKERYSEGQRELFDKEGKGEEVRMGVLKRMKRNEK